MMPQNIVRWRAAFCFQLAESDTFDLQELSMMGIFQNAIGGTVRIILAVLLAAVGSVANADGRPPAADFTSNRTGAVKSLVLPAGPTDDHVRDLIIANGGGGGFTNLLSGIYMASSMRGWVLYGPFVNSSQVAVFIVLTAPPGVRNGEYQALVNGAVVANGVQSTSFMVPPGSTYSWQTKDGSLITASAMASGATLAMVGLPNASDFASPIVVRGAYASCTDYWNHGDTDSFSHTTYYYFSTRSDKSSVGSNLVEGPEPGSHGVCDVV